VNVRAIPSLNGAEVGELRVGNTVSLYAPDVNGWCYVTTPALEGWCSRQNGAVMFEKVGAPPMDWTANLAVPFVSQIDASSAKSNNDCGIASLLMLQRWAMVHRFGLLEPTLPTVDDLEKYTVLAQPNPPKGLTFAQLLTLAKQIGFSSRYLSPLTMEKLIDLLDTEEMPVMVLVDYSLFNPSANAKIAHLCIIKGFNETEFLCHDPYLGGADYRISRVQLDAAMKTVPGNAGSYQGMVLAV